MNRWDHASPNVPHPSDLLTPTEPRPGQIIVFDQPLSFSNGRTLDRFEVVANPRSHRTVLFRAADIGGFTASPTSRSAAIA